MDGGHLATEMGLRPYQCAAIDRLMAGSRAGHRAQLLVAGTGSGKTVLAAYLMRLSAAKRERCVFIVDRVSLVDQTSAVFDRYGIEHGVVQAGHWRRRPCEPVQICSAQTIEKRGFFPDARLIIVDEAHCMRRQTTEMIRSTDAAVVGLTATPFTKGMGAIYSNVVNVSTTDKLIDEGYLVRPIMYAAKSSIDMTGAKTVAGEWTDGEVERRGKIIVGDIVNEWKSKTEQHFGRPVKTIAFSATVDHGDEICRQFQAAGYNFQQVSYRSPSGHQQAAIEEFRKPDSSIVGLVSCEVFSRGFDVPDILCGISARPYRKSFANHIQQLGRIMRPAPGKTSPIWLCHSLNAIRFHERTLELWANGVSELDDGEREAGDRPEPGAREIADLSCAGCGFVLPSPSIATCPACGLERRRRSLVEVTPGEMQRLEPQQTKQPAAKEAPGYLDNKGSVWRQICVLATERKNHDVEAARRWALAQYRNIYGEWPAGKYEPCLSRYLVDPRVERKVKANMIRYAKGKAK